MITRSRMLTEEITELVKTGQLHEFDADWICRLLPGDQMAAAVKCMRNFGVTGLTLDTPRSPVYIPKTSY